MNLWTSLSWTNKTLALFTATLRLLYADILASGLFALVIHVADIYGYATIKLFGYISTDVEVAYEYIGLSESGNQFIEGFTSAQYKEFIAEWKSLLLKYFQSGR